MSHSHPAKSSLAMAGVLLSLLGGMTGGTAAEVAGGDPARLPAATSAPDPLTVALSPHEGSEPLDEQIRKAQQRVKSGGGREVALDNLGRLFIAKARRSADGGFYKLAEQCALAMEALAPGNLDALHLRGHALDAMHHFPAAEAIARQLTGAREQMQDFALLGDALMEQGRLDEALPAYQQMADLKPCLQSYTRVAHFRWLKGDVEGAIEMMKLAIQSGSGRDPEPVAWASTRLALYQWQSGGAAAVEALSARAMALVPDYAPALLLQGRKLLGEGKAAEAIGPLAKACGLNPQAEYQWALAEALRAAREDERAAIVEQALETRGAADDPRTLSLYLATQGKTPEEALRLAQRELELRQDIFTYDALAWAQWANGQVEEARKNCRRALQEGTQDARLLLHAGVIGGAAGGEEAVHALQAANRQRQMLLPTERLLLDRQLSQIAVK